MTHIQTLLMQDQSILVITFSDRTYIQFSASARTGKEKVSLLSNQSHFTEPITRWLRPIGNECVADRFARLSVVAGRTNSVLELVKEISMIKHLEQGKKYVGQLIGVSIPTQSMPVRCVVEGEESVRGQFRAKVLNAGPYNGKTLKPDDILIEEEYDESKHGPIEIDIVKAKQYIENLELP